MIIDVDHFKAINDKFDHATGDAVLQQMATVLVNWVRAIDLVARYGGEQFAIVLPETVEPGAERVAERLREQVERHRFLDAEGEPLQKITISVGVAGHSSEVNESDVLIKLAEARLYDAKQGGRNRVMGASDLKTVGLPV